MNILRFSTLSLTLAVAVFALGYANPSFAAPKKCDDAPAGTPGCGSGDTGDDGDVALYSVTITGDVVGGSDTTQPQHWRGDFGGKNTIGLNDAVRETLVGEFTNLSFFSNLFDGHGKNCFPSKSSPPFDLDPALTIHQGSVSKKKRNVAQAGFFFDGWTHDEEKVRVLAELKLIGTFGSGETWPPSTGSSTLTMTDWEMSVTNAGQAIKKFSCIDKGSFTSGVTIMVTII